jgi:hypothetical protein
MESGDDLKQAILERLLEFYKTRTDKLGELRLKDIIRRKNPYLLRALGYNNPDELIESILDSFIKEGDETRFGEDVLEKIAIWAAQKRGGRKSNATGMDLEIDDGNTVHVYSIKSSPNWGNSSQWHDLNQNFTDITSRRRDKGIDCVVGSATGRAKSRKTQTQKKRLARIVSGQAFWKEISNDPEFYVKLIESMDDKVVLDAKEHFDASYQQALAKYQGEFKKEFCRIDGSIDWEGIVKFNSGER